MGATNENSNLDLRVLKRVNPRNLYHPQSNADKRENFFRKTQISLFSFLEQVQRLRPVSTVATAVLKSIDRNKFDLSTASSWVLVKRGSFFYRLLF